MDFIPLLRLRKSAMADCLKHGNLPTQRQQKLQQSLKILTIAPWITKGVILMSIVFGVNWKKTVPMSKRELPLALGAIGFCAISDYITSQYVWKEHEVEVVRLTGFKNGIYVSPERMATMREKMMKGNKMQAFEEDFQLENDEV